MLGAQTWVAPFLVAERLDCPLGALAGAAFSAVGTAIIVVIMKLRFPWSQLICFVLLSRPVHVEWCYNLLDLGAVPVSHFF